MLMGLKMARRTCKINSIFLISQQYLLETKNRMNNFTACKDCKYRRLPVWIARINNV